MPLPTPGLNPGRDSSWPLVLFGLYRPALAKHRGGHYAPLGLLLILMLAGGPYRLASYLLPLRARTSPFPFPTVDLWHHLVSAQSMVHAQIQTTFNARKTRS